MQLGWIDFSKEDRQKAFDVINLLSEQGAVDELGIGVIRDAFANYFFPGTSTIQTRAKYFLIVPYMLREAVDGRYGKDANRVLRAIDSAEKDCGIRLLEADPKAEGVIGSRVLPKGWVARKPSDIYWNGIRTFLLDGTDGAKHMKMGIGYAAVLSVWLVYSEVNHHATAHKVLQ